MKQFPMKQFLSDLWMAARRTWLMSGLSLLAVVLAVAAHEPFAAAAWATAFALSLTIGFLQLGRDGADELIEAMQQVIDRQAEMIERNRADLRASVRVLENTQEALENISKALAELEGRHSRKESS